MSIDFEAILKDDKTYPDTAEFELGGQKVTLGAIRDASKKVQAAVTDKMNALDKERNEVKTLAEQAATLHQTLQQQIEAAKTQTVTPPAGDDFDTDPFWQPVGKRFKAIQETQTKLDETVKQLTGAVQKAAMVFADDRWRNQFSRVADRLKKSEKYKDYTYEKVRDYAAEQKILDQYGFPSIEKAVAELTKDDELAIIRKEEYERGLREGQTKGRMGTMARPSSASGPAKPEKSAVGEKGLAALGDDVAADPGLMEMLSDLGAVGPEDILQ